MTRCDAVVIGGGLVGSAIVHQLALLALRPLRSRDLPARAEFAVVHRPA
jgi:hypothetical protein